MFRYLALFVAIFGIGLMDAALTLPDVGLFGITALLMFLLLIIVASWNGDIGRILTSLFALLGYNAMPFPDETATSIFAIAAVILFIWIVGEYFNRSHEPLPAYPNMT